MGQRIFQAMERSPIIAAVKNDEGLERVLHLEQKVVFLLYGDLCGAPDTVRRLHEAGKLAVVHTDLIAGLGSKEVAVDYVRSAVGADGIISTRPSFIRRGRELGLSLCCASLSLTPCPWRTSTGLPPRPSPM